MSSAESKVYRLRGIPGHLDRLGVALLLSRFIADGDQRDVSVASLALSCERWVITRTKTATLSFKKLPDIVSRDPNAGEWPLQDPTWAAPLLLDDTFFGLSPLNDIPENEHRFDCIVMSGLASHPMGSWQPHGNDKSFMWIRDALPHLVPNVKFILYGYDTKLAGSKSFQTVPDIALSLIHTLQQGGWAGTDPRKLIFFAHSLGGIVLKEAFRMLADSSVRDELILNRTRGVIFFGVPSQGLDVSDLQVMLQDQPNKDALVKEISNESPFVRVLEEQFSGISHLQKIKLLWAYETETTPTVITVDGKYKRSGPGNIFVSPLSATSQRCNFEPGSTIQINANHSNMVKFSPGSELIDRIAYKLQDMLKDGTEETDEEASEPSIEKMAAFHSGSQSTQIVVNHVDPAADPDFWDIPSIMRAIHAPERDSRLEQIDIAAGHSFSWAFEKSSVGLTSWLQNDEKLFWISGKPASGKSTLMKYLYNNPLTAKYLRKWRRSANFVRATFFFHHRGTAIQKSLEGLYRGILSRVLKKAPQSFLTIQSRFVQAYQAAVRTKNLGTLSRDLEALVAFCKVSPHTEILGQLHKVLCCEMPLKAFRAIVVEPMLSTGVIDRDEDLLHQVYPLRDTLLAAYNKDKTNVPSASALNDIISKIRKSWTENEEFISLVKEWLEAIDINTQLSNLRDLLMSRTSSEPYMPKNTNSQPDELIKKILTRFSARETQRIRIETANWSLEHLNHAIGIITDQQLVDLDLCIFIDALDEHDGPPEFISQFIRDIASAKGSRTRLKILFSSRPWQPFIDAFGHSPSIQIHEFTENDIRELCLHTIRPENPGSAEILQLVEEIVNQARGVFLWVKLVLNDLLDNAARLTTSGIDAADLHAALLDILKSLPADLEQYYKTIIERIPHSYRWEAFCLLEAVSKSTRPIYLKEMPSILLCANIQKVNEIYPRMLKIGRSRVSVYTKEHLRTHSGGLVETIGADELQLLHQTLVEFVQLPEFKCIVLGERYRITKENGYTILTKYEALRGASYSDHRIQIPVSELFSKYAQEAESTTGNSAYFSFTSATWSVALGNNAFPLDMPNVPYTTLEVALACELKLHLQDTLKHNKETKSVFIFRILVRMIQRGVIDIDSAIELLQAMVSQGLQIHASYFGLLILMDRIHFMTPGSSMTMAIKFFQSVMTAFFEPGADVEVSTNTTGLDTAGHQFREFIRSQGPRATIQALHLPFHYKFTEYLLNKGADPNGLTSKNLTPLDCWVKRNQWHGIYPILVVPSTLLLIRRGGHLNICTREEWKGALKMVSEIPNLALPFPGWLEGAPGADIDESQAVTPTQLNIGVNTRPTKLRESRVGSWLKSSLRSMKRK
ncbi:Protein SERAC1 [Trichoderma lentiforme]|uniref:Protein SERAC1 n=1 Tax=Trichoderma lentiforme TaxID=1567552 RepID=A0A9P4XCP7_9HYPO|nr:Protein SERAC1 [Trichoderma lentiforme]